MNARMIGRIETNVQRTAAALFAAAVGFSVFALLEPHFSRLGYALGATVVAYLFCAGGLELVARPKARLKVPVFDLREFEPFEAEELLLTVRLHDELVLTEADRLVDELVLTSADRLPPHGSGASEPLVLDDVLAAVGADSRVVHLFDRKAMPTPGQLSTTIDRHLEQGSRPPQGDAAQALSDALAELRRSLR